MGKFEDFANDILSMANRELIGLVLPRAIKQYYFDLLETASDVMKRSEDEKFVNHMFYGTPCEMYSPVPSIFMEQAIRRPMNISCDGDDNKIVCMMGLTNKVPLAFVVVRNKHVYIRTSCVGPYVIHTPMLHWMPSHVATAMVYCAVSILMFCAGFMFEDTRDETFRISGILRLRPLSDDESAMHAQTYSELYQCVANIVDGLDFEEQNSVVDSEDIQTLRFHLTIINEAAAFASSTNSIYGR